MVCIPHDTHVAHKIGSPPQGLMTVPFDDTEAALTSPQREPDTAQRWNESGFFFFTALCCFLLKWLYTSRVIKTSRN